MLLANFRQMRLFVVVAVASQQVRALGSALPHAMPSGTGALYGMQL